MRVSVVHAFPDRTWEREVEVEAGATLRVAVERSGVLQAFPALADAPLSLGIFGRLRTLDDPLHDGDRVEVYRPLQVDPKEARRLRAERRRRGGGPAKGA